MIDVFDIPDLVPRLVDRSLVVYEEATGRYSLLETVRQYAAEHSLNHEDSAGLRDRHLSYYKEFTRDCRRKLRGADQVRWLAQFDEEYDDIRLALDWSLSSELRCKDGVILAYQIRDYWEIRSRFEESLAWIARMQPWAASLDIAGRCRILLIQSLIRYYTSQANAEQALDALQLARETGDPVLIGQALVIGILDSLQVGRIADARALKDEVFETLAIVDDQVMIAFAHMNFGNTALAEGDLDEAESHYEECLKIREQTKDFRGIGSALCSLGYINQYRGNVELAIQQFRKGVPMMAAVGTGWGVAGALPCFCLELTLAGRFEDAARVLGYSEAGVKRVGGKRDRVDGPNYEHWMNVVSQTLGKDKFDALFQAGTLMSPKAVKLLLFPDGLPATDREYL